MQDKEVKHPLLRIQIEEGDIIVFTGLKVRYYNCHKLLKPQVYLLDVA